MNNSFFVLPTGKKHGKENIEFEVIDADARIRKKEFFFVVRRLLITVLWINCLNVCSKNNS